MRSAVNPMRSGTIEVNGARLYFESRGSGPALLCITGGGQDAGEFESIAEELADGFTVVTYDRRGCSRSPGPMGWTSTSVQEHADDAAGLLDALGMAPAAVFGTSSGATILLDLIIRRPECLRVALVHEPPIVGVLPNAREVGQRLQSLIQQGMAKGGPRAAMELFMRTMGGDATYGAIPPNQLERIQGNAETFFLMEMPAFVSYVPDGDAIAAAGVPVVSLAGADSQNTFLYETACWVADKVGAEVVELPGGHAGFAQHPEEAAAILRRVLNTMS